MGKKSVLRSCALTHEKLEKKDLFRIVRTKEGQVIIDDTYKLNGRGCYLKKDKEVIEKAQKTKALERNLSVEVQKEIYEQLIKKI